MAGLSSLDKFELGVESTFDTAVACTTLWRGKCTHTDESEPQYPDESVGFAGGLGRNYIPHETGTINIEETPMTFEQLPYLLNMGIDANTGVQDGAGSDYVYTYPIWYDSTNIPVPNTYTWRVGDNQQAYLYTGAFVEEMTLKGAYTEALMMEATLRAHADDSTTTFTGGLSVPAVTDMLFGNCKMYIDPVGSAFGTTQITQTFLSFELTINNMFKAQMTGDGTSLFATLMKANMPEIELTFTLEHDATSVTERAARAAGTPRKIRIENTGPAVATPGTTYSNKTLFIDLVGTYMAPEERDDDDGNNTMTFVLKNHYNVTAATRGTITVVNELSALP